MPRWSIFATIVAELRKVKIKLAFCSLIRMFESLQRCEDVLLFGKNQIKFVFSLDLHYLCSRKA